MEASGSHPQSVPVLVVDLLELARLEREQPGRFGALNVAYGESYTWKHTDVGGAAGAILSNQNVPVLSGDVRAIGGWSFAEATGTTTASIRLYDGSAQAQAAIVRINLAANESTRDFVTGHGIEIQTGRVFMVLAGSVEGTVYWR